MLVFHCYAIHEEGNCVCKTYSDVRSIFLYGLLQSVNNWTVWI